MNTQTIDHLNQLIGLFFLLRKKFGGSSENIGMYLLDGDRSRHPIVQKIFALPKEDRRWGVCYVLNMEGMEFDEDKLWEMTDRWRREMDVDRPVSRSEHIDLSLRKDNNHRLILALVDESLEDVESSYSVQEYVEKKPGVGRWIYCDDLEYDYYRTHSDKIDAIHACREFIEDNPDSVYRVQAWDYTNERTVYTMSDYKEEE